MRPWGECRGIARHRAGCCSGVCRVNSPWRLLCTAATHKLLRLPCPPPIRRQLCFTPEHAAALLECSPSLQTLRLVPPTPLSLQGRCQLSSSVAGALRQLSHLRSLALRCAQTRRPSGAALGRSSLDARPALPCAAQPLCLPDSCRPISPLPHAPLLGRSVQELPAAVVPAICGLDHLTSLVLYRHAGRAGGWACGETRAPQQARGKHCHNLRPSRRVCHQ